VEQYRTYRFEVRGQLCSALFCRIAVYNKALKLQRARMTERIDVSSCEASCQELVRWKSDPECVWLNDSPSQALQQSLKDLDRTQMESLQRTYWTKQAFGCGLMIREKVRREEFERRCQTIACRHDGFAIRWLALRFSLISALRR
jgi:hypothetical protein